MTVNTKPASDKSKVDAKPAEAVAPVDIQLNNYARYYFRGIVYERDVKYTVSNEMAKVLLQHEEEGVPVFGRYRMSKVEKERIVQASGPRVVNLTTPEAVASARSDTVVPNRIEVGTAEEEAELFGGEQPL